MRTPVFGVEVPVLAHRLADPEKGRGIAMVCTFGDTTDVTWWRELRLATRRGAGPRRPVPARRAPGIPAEAYAPLVGKTVHTGREIMVRLLRESRCPARRAATDHAPVKFYEKGDRPLEIVASRQWYLRNGGRDATLRERMLARGRELNWHPDHMRARYDNWVEGLAGDWLVSRQRFFGVPIPFWYRLDAHGEPRHDRPIVPGRALPVDPSRDAAAGVHRGPAG